jgi:hypothetical protein
VQMQQLRNDLAAKLQSLQNLQQPPYCDGLVWRFPNGDTIGCGTFRCKEGPPQQFACPSTCNNVDDCVPPFVCVTWQGPGYICTTAQ